MEFLKMEAKQIIEESIIINKLHSIPCKFKKYPGNTYHLYQDKNNQYYLSKLTPVEWSNNPPDKFVNSFYYDYDKSFTLFSA